MTELEKELLDALKELEAAICGGYLTGAGRNRVKIAVLNTRALIAKAERRIREETK